MFELLIIACVTVGFYRQARFRDKSGLLWAMIGVASYFGPKFLMARVLYAWMANPWIRSGSAAQLWLFVAVLSVGAGALGCALAVRCLTEQWPWKKRELVAGTDAM